MEDEEEEQAENDNQTFSSDYNDVVAYNELPPIKPRDTNDNNTDSLLIIDGRSYRIQPDVRKLIKIYYHDHELFCDTRTKDVYVDTKRVYKMGDTTREIMLNGRRVRLMYMGKRIELWIDGISFHFRADSPPKQVSLTSSQSNQLKRYYVTIDSRTNDMYFNNYKVCKINGGPHGNGDNIINVKLSPDEYETHEISFVCPPKKIMIDGQPRKMRYDLAVPCIEMDNGQYHVIRFSGLPREIYIDDQPFKVPFDKTVRIKLNGRAHELAWGGPGFEVIIDGRPYELQFNKPPREVIIGTKPHFIYIGGDAPDVKICGRLPNELLQDYETYQDNRGQPQPVPLMSQEIPNPPGSSAQAALKPALDVHELLKKLTDHNILPKTAQKNKQAKVEEEKVPDLTSLEPELLKQKYQGAIQSLYSGIQCATCGNRFNQNESSGASSSNRYAKHLDWHFRQNKKEKDEVNKAHSRSWYYNLADWILYEELSEESALSQMESDLGASTGQSGSNEQKKKGKRDKNNLLSSDDEYDENSDDNLLEDSNIVGQSMLSNTFISNGTKTCPATDDIDDSCYICKDPFEIFWFSSKEEWHFKDAIRVENRLYHPICYEDDHDKEEINNTSQYRNPTDNNSFSTTSESQSTEPSASINRFLVKNEPMVDEERASEQDQDQIMGSMNDSQMTENETSMYVEDSNNDSSAKGVPV